MSQEWFVRLDRDIPSFHGMWVGKEMDQAHEALSDLARQLHVPPLDEFMNVNPHDGTIFLEEGMDPNKAPIPDEQWHDPARALLTVDALQECLKEPGSSYALLLPDLDSLETVLKMARKAGARFHLSVDP